MDKALETAMRDVAELGAEMENGDDLGTDLSVGEELAAGLGYYERLEAVVKVFNRGEMTYRVAEEVYNIGRMRIQRCVSRKVRMKARNGAKPVLTEGEEAGILETIDKRTNRAQCMTDQESAAFVRKCIEASPHERIIPAKFPSLRWIKRFQKRHSGVFSQRKPQRLDECRAKASTTENVTRFFEQLRETLKLAPDLSPSRFWNLDETGMCGQGSRKGKMVLATKGKPANVQQSDDRTNVSALVCVNADGGHVPPFFILPGVNVREASIHDALPGSRFSSSKSSFLTTELYIQYFEWFVDRIPPEHPVLVLMDGYKAHLSAQTLEHARKNGILLHTIPAHTSHFLQPLDVTVFWHFKRELDKEIAAFRVRNKRAVTNEDMVEVDSIALPRCWTRTYVVGGFEKPGIYPMNNCVMLSAIIGDGPTERPMVVLKPTLITSQRTQNKLKREGLDPDTVRVLSLDHWEMVEVQERKKAKQAKPDAYINRGVLMTADDIVARVKAKEEAKRQNLLNRKQGKPRKFANKKKRSCKGTWQQSGKSLRSNR